MQGVRLVEHKCTDECPGEDEQRIVIYYFSPFYSVSSSLFYFIVFFSVDQAVNVKQTHIIKLWPW